MKHSTWLSLTIGFGLLACSLSAFADERPTSNRTVIAQTAPGKNVTPQARKPVVRQEVIPHHQDRPPGPALSPQEAIQKMTVPEGFTVELVAAEPDIVNPIAMTFDERGRVWITESLEYPRRSPGAGKDRIKVLEDTNGDGKADKITIFADGLNIPSGIAVGYGGVWVANSPDILFLRDTDGDGKADEKKVIVTGFGRFDTHELPNSLTWGPDGWLYGLNGVFNYGEVTHQGKTQRFTCTLFRIHPVTHEFQLFAEGTSNPWGIAFDNNGSAFLSACVIDHLWHITETGYYRRQAGAYPPFTWRIESIVQHKHQKAAYCGIHYFDSDAYPAEYRNVLYMGNIHGNCINSDVLERDGSTYFGRPRPDFLSANDAWFMPVVQKTGPDGSLYILDWYDRYHCYQDANRDPAGIDRLKGRLYRVRYKDTPRVWGFNLAEESDDALIERLSHAGNDYFRSTIQRVLTERMTPTLRTKLQAVVLKPEVDERVRNAVLWSLIGSGELEAGFHQQLLAHASPTVRAWGVRAAGNFGQVSDDVRRRLLELVNDPAPDVKLQVAITASKMESVQTIPTLLDVLENAGDDKLIPHIVWQNLHPQLEEHSGEFLNLLAEHRSLESPNVARLMPRVVERILARKDPDPQPVVRLFAMLTAGTDGLEDSARRCLAVLASRIQNKEIRGTQLDGLRDTLSPALSRILAGQPTDPLYLDAAFLATTWNDSAGVAAVRRVLDDPDSADKNRLAALHALIAVRNPELLVSIDTILRQRQANTTEFRGQLISSLGRLDNAEVAPVLLKHYAELEEPLQPRVVELLTQRTVWSRELLAAIGEKQVPANALNLNQVRQLLSTEDPAIVDLVKKQWGTIRERRNPQREHVISEMKRLIRQTPGDAFAGEKVFKRVCGQCHKIYGEGAEVGPDITSNGRNAFHQLLSNVFDPSLVIGAAYQARIVATEDGRVLTGLPVEDTEQRVVLKVQGGKLETIARDDIEVMKTSEISMMPEQLEKQLKPQEIADLFAYLILDKPPGDPMARQLSGVHFTEPREAHNSAEIADILAEAAPGFVTDRVGEGGVTLLPEHAGRSYVVRTHPVDKKTPCVLTGTFQVPADTKSRLMIEVGHHPQGDWQLRVRINGKEKLSTIVGGKSTRDGWGEYSVDLSEFAGKKIDVALANKANGWSYEFAYWGRVSIISE